MSLHKGFVNSQVEGSSRVAGMNSLTARQNCSLVIFELHDSHSLIGLLTIFSILWSHANNIRSITKTHKLSAESIC